MGRPEERLYSEEEAEEILRLALRQSGSGAIDRTRLVYMASELGISEEALVRAEQDLQVTRDQELVRRMEEADHEDFRRHRRRELWSTLSSYVGVNGFLVAMWWFTGQGYFWPFWVMAAWGIGIVSEIASVITKPTDRDFQRWRDRRDRRLRRRAAGKDVDEVLGQLARELPGRKEEAIHELRQRLGYDLKQAKNAIDEYDEVNGEVFSRCP